MKKYIRISTVVLLCLIITICIAGFSVFASEKETLNLGGGAKTIEYISGVTTWAEAVKNANSNTVYITESGLICAVGNVVVDEYGEPVKPSDVISLSQNYERLANSIFTCSIYNSADLSLVYLFKYFKGWTFYDFVNYAKENGTTKIDVTAGIAYYRTDCVNYPLMMSSTAIKGDTVISESFVVDLLSEDTISFHVTEETITKEATCTSVGEYASVCKDCGTVLTRGTVPALGHDWKDATCTDPKTCRVCGAKESEALGHDYSFWGVCKDCGHFDLFKRNARIGSSDNENRSDGSGGIFDSVGDSISGGVESVKNWFSDLGKTIDTLFGMLLGVLGILMFCILGTWIVRFIRELFLDYMRRK